MGLPTGVSLVVGCYITGACITAGVSRFSKTRKDAFRGTFLGLSKNVDHYLLMLSVMVGLNVIFYLRRF